jgi:hypothetical protein
MTAFVIEADIVAFIFPISDLCGGAERHEGASYR